MDNSVNAWGKRVIEKALEYANYRWTASEKNVMHLFASGYQIYRKN